MFGQEACTSGASQDFRQATAFAAQYVRHYAFGTRLSRTDVTNDADDNLNTDVRATNPEIEALLAQEHARALALLEAHAPAFMSVVEALMQEGSVAPSKLAELLDLPADAGAGSSTDAYAALLATFKARRLPGAPTTGWR